MSSSSSSSLDLEPLSQPSTQNVTVIALLPELLLSSLPSILPNVSSLILTNCCLGVSEVLYLGEVLSQNTTLLVLDLSLNSLTPRGTKAIMEGLMMNSTLTTLNLSDCSLCSDFGVICAAMLTTNTTLRSLNLSKNPLEFGAQEIITSLTSNTTLKELDLSACGLDVPMFCSVSAMLITNRSLQSLNLSENNFGSNETVVRKYIDIVTKHNKTLKMLDLHNTRIAMKYRQMIFKVAHLNLSSGQVVLSAKMLAHPAPQRHPSPPPKRIRSSHSRSRK